MEKQIQWLLKEKYFGQPTAGFDRDVKRLEAGEPLAYVIGFVDFLDCRIDLAKRPLIPRPETEHWVGEAIKSIQEKRENKTVKVLDIFAGSGCIGISIVRHIKNASVVFAEHNKNLLAQIRKNCRLNKIPTKRYKVLQSDIFSKIATSQQFDHIFANPPYIPIARKHKIQPSVLAHEPGEALFGGKDGLLFIKKFLWQAKKYLAPGGTIYMEFDSIQKKKIGVLAKKYGYKKVIFHKDQFGRWRWAELRKTGD